MADRSTSDPTPNSDSTSNPDPAPNSNAPRPTGRPVYESTLLPTRRRRRLSPWLVAPPLLILLLVVFYFLVFGPKPRRAVATAGTLIYASDASSPGTPHLWSIGLDGAGGHPLTSGPAADTNPVYTADGNQIVFLSNRGGGQNQLWLIDADGKNAVQVTRTAGAKSQPAFAPGSNSLLGFLSGASLAVMDVGKGDASLILPTPGGTAHPESSDSNATDPTQSQDTTATVVSFAWKPGVTEGTAPGLAAVLENSGVQTLAVMPTLSSNPRLTQNDQPSGRPLAAADGLSLAWAPDGSRLALGMLRVLGLPGGRKVSGLVQFDALGNVQKALLPLVQDPALGPQNPVFSPDGTQVAFEVWRQADLASRTRLGLFIVTSDGTGQPHRLAQGDAGSAQFSRDGSEVFFLLRRGDGGHDLCRVNADGTGEIRLSDGHADVTSFALSPQSVSP